MTPTDPSAKPTAVPHVGPVLTANPLGYLVAAAIEAQNPGATVVNRGAYLRVLAQGSCRLELAALAESVGAPIEARGLLEQVMPSFQGRISFGEGVVEWT